MAYSKYSRLASVFTLPIIFLCLFLSAKSFPHLHFDEIGNPHAHAHPTDQAGARTNAASHDTLVESNAKNPEYVYEHAHSHAEMHLSFPQYWLRPAIYSGENFLEFKDVRWAGEIFRAQGPIVDWLHASSRSIALSKIKQRFNLHHIQFAHLHKILSVRLTI